MSVKQWGDYNDVNKNLNPAKHLAGNIEHEFSYVLLFS